MKLHITILLSAVIIAAGLVVAARQTNDVRLFADDMLASRKTISRADVIHAVQGLDQNRLLSAVTRPDWHVTALRVVDAKAALDGKSIGIFSEAVLPGGSSAALNFSFTRDDFGRWVIAPKDGIANDEIVLPL